MVHLLVAFPEERQRAWVAFELLSAVIVAEAVPVLSGVEMTAAVLVAALALAVAEEEVVVEEEEEKEAFEERPQGLGALLLWVGLVWSGSHLVG